MKLSPLKYLPLASCKRAATPAACGAAAEVPKKLGKMSPSIAFPSANPKLTVVFTPFGATKSGLFLFTPFIKTPPLDEKEAIVGGFIPKAGVFLYKTAPTAMAFSAFACPKIVPWPWLNSTILPSPLKITYLKRTFSVPLFLVIRILAFTFASTTNGRTSKGSPPWLFLLNPNFRAPDCSIK